MTNINGKIGSLAMPGINVLQVKNTCELFYVICLKTEHKDMVLGYISDDMVKNAIPYINNSELKIKFYQVLKKRLLVGKNVFSNSFIFREILGFIHVFHLIFKFLAINCKILVVKRGYE